MSFGATSDKSWAPPSDDTLSWFRVDLFGAPRPLEFTGEISALIFGLTYALESLEFPLYAVRSQLKSGRVYLAAVPSAMAENNLAQRLKNIHTQSVRFTRNIRSAWERQLRPEIDLYNERFDEIANFTGNSNDLAEKLRSLKRDRGNQWFTVIRGVLAPTVLVQRHLDEFGHEIAELSKDLTRQALEFVAVQGKALIRTALARAGDRLVEASVVDHADDVFWLEWKEVVDFLGARQNRRALVVERRAQAARDAESLAPDRLGPPLEPDAPRMYLIREILQLLDG
jgi:hypothetical protein